MSDPESPRSFALAMVATLAWMITLLMPFAALHWLEKAAPLGSWRLSILAWLVLHALTSAFMDRQMGEPSSERVVLLFVGGIVLAAAVFFAGCVSALSSI